MAVDESDRVRAINLEKVDHVVVVTHRGRPEGWYPEAPFYFVDRVESAMVKAQEFAGEHGSCRLILRCGPAR